jgi:1,4-alpha-glucan branching enzyme
MANNHRNHRTTKPSAVRSLREVEFHFESATAKSVHLAGAFNEWATGSLPLRRKTNGHWRVRVPLTPGPHQYRFVVDGLWVDDPTACRHADNSFGSCNCEILVQ